MKFPSWIVLGCAACFCSLSPAVFADGPVMTKGKAWRSKLYPENWVPGLTDTKGRFLHDFSYAGYGRGERAPDTSKLAALDATDAPYLADPSGVKDSTLAIQAALNAAAEAGGAIVLLPPGTYRISPQNDSPAILRIRADRVVLRGAGAGKTFLWNDATAMRSKNVLVIEPAESVDWREEKNALRVTPLENDLPAGSIRIPTEESASYSAGDRVVLRSDLTQRFIDEVEMTGKWTPAGAESPNRTLMFYRNVVAVQPGALILDVPTRYPLKTADNARLVKLPGKMISECGLEDFSFGNAQHPGTGLLEEDHKVQGTVAYDASNSRFITFRNAENCWVKGLKTYAPGANDPKIHLLSNALALVRSRFVTVSSCDFKFPQYRGGNGNGYLYTMQGQENLVIDCVAEGGRHNYDFGTMAASGNVISRCLSKDGKLASDFHMFLSMANLLDQVTCDGDFLEARYIRPFGGNPMHGVTTTQSVFWNTKGLRYPEKPKVLILSHQVGHGYIIGTSGPCDKVDSSDYMEGIGEGAGLEPASLYRDQLRRRIGK